MHSSDSNYEIRRYNHVAQMTVYLRYVDQHELSSRTMGIYANNSNWYE